VVNKATTPFADHRFAAVPVRDVPPIANTWNKMETSGHPCCWPAAPTAPVLRPGDVHLWCASLEVPPAVIARLRETLSDDEGRRADRFRAGPLRDHFVAGRGTLRAILGRYLGGQPRGLRFDYEPHGKPQLAPPWDAGGLRFNVSHSHGLAVVGVTAGREIGVDVERVRPRVNAARLIERFFSPEERRQWQRLPEESRLTAFFCGWTRKEAWLKAVGHGLSFPLGDFSVSLAPDEPARLLAIRGSTAEAAAWWLESCPPGPDYVAAVAVRGRPANISRWRYWCPE
jgi:4'-phosphopantetheinyl transferase